MADEGLLAHLEALRKMLLEILAIFIVLLIPGWYFAPTALAALQTMAARIAGESGVGHFELQYFSLMEPFTVELKTGMILALGAGMPLYFWRIWVFLAPALYRNERRALGVGAIAAWGLFAAGAALGIFGVAPLLVRFSMSFARDGLMPMIGLGNFTMLLLTVALAFGAMFELPLLLLILAVCGVVSLDSLRSHRSTVLIVVLVLAAILTPPDVVSQLMLAVPTYLLFELTLLLGRCWVKPPADNPEAPDAGPDSMNPAGGEAEPDADVSSELYQRAGRRRTRRRMMPSQRSHRLGR